MEGDGNCLTNSVIAQLAMETDPGAKELYIQIYLRRSVIRHLIANWNVLGEEITEDIWMLYGRPDSELNGKPLLKWKGKSNKEAIWLYAELFLGHHDGSCHGLW